MDIDGFMVTLALTKLGWEFFVTYNYISKRYDLFPASRNQQKGDNNCKFGGGIFQEEMVGSWRKN